MTAQRSCSSSETTISYARRGTAAEDAGGQTFFSSFFVSLFPSFVNSGGGTGTAGACIAEAALYTSSTSGSRSFEGPAPRASDSVI